jgi:flagellar hook-basal body complex protein FliE
MAGIDAISAVSGIKNVFNENSKLATEKTEPEVSFKSVLAGLINKTNETDNNDKMANLELLTGDLDNMHDVIIAGEEADLSLRLTMAIRNKALDAYNEIIKMQV